MDWVSHYLAIAKEYARDYVLENTGLKVLALLITAVLWLSIASRPVSQIPIANVPIEFLNLSQSPLLAVSKYDTLFARVFVEGPRDVLDSLRSSQIAIVADMANVEPGVRVIPLKVDSSQLPANVRVREIDPRSVRVTVERVIEKEVPVIPRFEGQPTAGYEQVGWQVTPSSIKIAGAESQLRDVKDVSTETIRLTERTDNFSERVAIDTGSPNVNLSGDSPHQAMVQVNISEIRTERTLDRVPVTVENAPRNARAFPPFVRVSLEGAVSAIRAMTDADVTVTVDYQGPNAGKKYTPQIVVSSAFADKVIVRSYQPQQIVIR